jgi:hypothetical protein
VKIDSRTGVLGAVFLAGCLFSKETPEPKDIVPLAVGNTWVYVDSTVFSPDSVITNTSEVNVIGTRRVVAPGSGGADSVTVFLGNTKNVGTGQPGTVSLYWRTVGHSHYTYGAEETGAAFMDITPHVIWPAKAGDTHLTHFTGFQTVNGNRVPALDTIEIRMINPDTVCVVPAGTFACVHLQGYRLSGTLFADAYYAPGVGNLGNEQRSSVLIGDSLRTVRVVKKLTSYTLH